MADKTVEDEFDEVVRIDGEIVIPVSVVVTRDQYEAWQDGDPDALNQMDMTIDAAAGDEMGQTLTAEDVQLREAWLVETGQGHPIVRLKKWDS